MQQISNVVPLFLLLQEMLMSRRLPDSHPRQPSSIKRRLFQDDEDQTEDPADDEEARERHRRLQMNRESETENFLNRQVEQLDDISRHRWNFDFRNETPINNNDGQWEWNVEVVKLSETNVPKIYLNVLNDEPPDGSSSNEPRNCPTCSKNSRLENLSTPTKSTEVFESQTPVKKRPVQANQSSTSKVPKSSSNDMSTPSEVTVPPPDTVDDPIVENVDNVVATKQDTIKHNETDDTSSNNNDIPPE